MIAYHVIAGLENTVLGPGHLLFAPSLVLDGLVAFRFNAHLLVQIFLQLSVERILVPLLQSNTRDKNQREKSIVTRKSMVEDN